MANRVLETEVTCPYCWESFTLLVDGSVDDQAYVEDCEICCRPIDFVVTIDEYEQANVEALRQDA
ncbi:MAG: CPXCG motif-containing cysteine-rich protein [Gammaproteobacteria bacterium]|nr:CPXCG motif-containing cysteine-rich protein [Gammaproteobacteria bacterium]